MSWRTRAFIYGGTPVMRNRGADGNYATLDVGSSNRTDTSTAQIHYNRMMAAEPPCLTGPEARSELALLSRPTEFPLQLESAPHIVPINLPDVIPGAESHFTEARMRKFMAIKNQYEVPPGHIVLWVLGEGYTIPEGWRECDGTHGTPDLRETPAYPGILPDGTLMKSPGPTAKDIGAVYIQKMGPA